MEFWKQLLKRKKNGGRAVCFMTFDLKQKVFEQAVKDDDMELMRKLLDLSDKQRARRK